MPFLKHEKYNTINDYNCQEIFYILYDICYN
nr:MAG TPA: hypothetical protein [Caudoviricetes sp.]